MKIHKKTLCPVNWIGWEASDEGLLKHVTI